MEENKFLNPSSIQFRVDDEFKNLIPPLSADEYNQLEENILRDGIQDPLKVWQGILIDGHNRYSIAQKHGLTFNVTEMNFDNREDALMWMYQNQLGRRNLSAYDRGVIALKLKPHIAAKAKENQMRKSKSVLANLPEQNPMDTRQTLAKIADVSPRTLAKVEKIEQSATPEIKRDLKENKLSIDSAYKRVVGIKDNSSTPIRAKPIVKNDSNNYEQLKQKYDVLKNDYEQLKKSYEILQCEVKELRERPLEVAMKISSNHVPLENLSDTDTQRLSKIIDGTRELQMFFDSANYLLNLPNDILKAAVEYILDSGMMTLDELQENIENLKLLNDKIKSYIASTDK